jgi:hypothetical protein
MIKAMPEQWIVRVEEKDYGPADLETLHEWKREGRVLPANPARRTDVDPATGAASAEEALWTTAADIPGLFDAATPVSAAEPPPPPRQTTRQSPQRSFGQVLAETIRIYRAGFFQFLGLTLLTVLPSVCGQLTTAFIGTSPNVDVDLRTLATGAFGLCMLVLTLVLWPVYIAGIQLLSAEFAAGRRVSLVTVLNQAGRFWPRVAGLCLFVYGVFFLLSIFGLGIAAMMLATPGSLIAAVLALGLLVVQVWLFSRFFINVLFWQQFAVLENAGIADSLRLSKQLARSGHDLPWFRRPLWRGALIASLWFAFVLAIAFVQEWPMLRDYFQTVMTTQDPQVLLQKLTAAQQTHGFDLSRFALHLLQRIFQPLLGIAFVVLYLDSKSQIEE